MRVLIVEDDEIMREMLAVNLSEAGYQAAIAESGEQALEMLAEGEFRLVVSDWVMPGMSGLDLCREIRKRHSERYVYVIVVTSRNSTEDVVAALDAGADDFIAKPAQPAELCVRLRVGERVLALEDRDFAILSKTLSGSVSVLTQILSLVNPTAFGHANRVRRLVREMCQLLRLKDAWEIEIAAMLSQVGCITIPESTMAKLSRGAHLTSFELRSYQGHPQVGHDLIAKIPRLEGVAEIIAYQQKRFNGIGMPENGFKGKQIPIGSRILKLVIDIVQLLSADIPTETALGIIRDRQGWYDPSLIDALATVLNVDYVVSSVTINELEEGMVLNAHVVSNHNDILLARGQDVTIAMREQLLKFSATAMGVREPIQVQRPIRRSEMRTIETQERVNIGSETEILS